MRMRERVLASALAYLLVVSLLAVAVTRADRYPVDVVWIGLALLAPPVGAGLAGRGWWLLALVPVPPVTAFLLLSAFEVDYAITLFLFALAAGIAALLLLPLGITIGRRIHPRRASVAGAAILVMPFVLVPVAALESRRTVTVERPQPRPVDERAGRYRGAGLGDRVPEVRARLGRGERVTADDPRRRGVGPDVTTGFGPGDVTGEELRYGRDLAFLLDRRERVEFVAIADRRAQTRGGVGPGDSLSRFRKAYPGMRCGEGDDGGGESPFPFPACRVQVAANRWLYVAGTYERPGEPAVFLVLSRRRLPY